LARSIHLEVTSKADGTPLTRGLLNGLLISLALWALIALVAYFLLR